MPLYIRAASELLGRDVVGGLYQSVKGDEAPRGVLRATCAPRARWTGSRPTTTWSPSCSSSCSTRRETRAAESAGRMRVGDVCTIRRTASARRGAAGTASAGWRARERPRSDRAAAGGRRRARRGRRRGRRGHGQDDARDRAGARRARVGHGARARARRHVHRGRGARALGLAPRACAARGQPMPHGPRSARSTPSPRACCASTPRRPGCPRSCACSTRRRRSCSPRRPSAMRSRASAATATSVAARPARRVRRRRLARASSARLDARLRGRGRSRSEAAAGACGGSQLLAPLLEAAKHAAAALAGDDRVAGGDATCRRLARIEALLAGTRRPSAICSRSVAARGGEAAGQVGALLEALQDEARARLEHEVGAAVATLLERYREAYRARKEAELALDFDDLQERACELLARPEIGAEVRERFDLVLVDEFQDTNGLQCLLLDALAGADCQRVYVGDACQSIYRFRYADVELFRARGEQRRGAPPADGQLSLAPRAAGGHRPRLRHSASASATSSRRTRCARDRADRASRRWSCTSWRAPRARRAPVPRARSRRTRSRGACASSWTRACRPGDIAVLLRSARDASTYAAALERVGLVGAQPARPRLLPLAAGARPVRLPRTAAQPLRRSRAAGRARLAARRRLQRRALGPPRRSAARALLADRARPARGAAGAGPGAGRALQGALRPVSCARAASSAWRHCWSGSSPTTTTTSPACRARRRAPLRQRAQARARRARLRARPRPRPGRLRRADAPLRRARPQRGRRPARRR